MKNNLRSTLIRALAVASALAAPLAFGHVSLDPARVEAGTAYRGVLRIAHGCDGAPTTSLDVQMPGGGARSISTVDKREVPIELQAPAKAGPLWIKVVQHCGAASVNWAQTPEQGTSTEGMKTPAVLLQVLSREEWAALASQPRIEGGWVRASVPGQSATGAFMRIIAKEPMQLIGAVSPVAASAEVHAMKMDGDVMRMRPAGPVDLPVGRAFELTPGGFHLMLQDLKQPLATGSTVPVTLILRNAKGVESRLELKLPVSTAGPGASGEMQMDHGADHKH